MTIIAPDEKDKKKPGTDQKDKKDKEKKEKKSGAVSVRECDKQNQHLKKGVQLEVTFNMRETQKAVHLTQ